MGAPMGRENRVELEAGEKWSEAREVVESTDIRGFCGCEYCILSCNVKQAPAQIDPVLFLNLPCIRS